MNGHEHMRELLPLAAAGALDASEQRMIDEHVTGCAECAAALEAWRALAGELGVLPSPMAPEWLVERTRNRVTAEWAEREQRRAESWTLVVLAVFSLVLSIGPWLGVSQFAGTHAAVWFAAWMAISWLSAGAAAVVLGVDKKRRREL